MTNTLSWSDILSCIPLILLMALVISSWNYRKTIPTHYEWLKILSHYEWKEFMALRKEMTERQGKRLSMSIMRADLNRLKREGFVQHQIILRTGHGMRIPMWEFKLTPAGIRRKIMYDENPQEIASPLQHT